VGLVFDSVKKRRKGNVDGGVLADFGLGVSLDRVESDTTTVLRFFKRILPTAYWQSGVCSRQLNANVHAST
jgi:hypothetical protein